MDVMRKGRREVVRMQRTDSKENSALYGNIKSKSIRNVFTKDSRVDE